MPVLVAEPTPLKRRRASVLLDSALGTISNTLPFSGFATKPAGSSAVAADAAVLQRVAELEKRLEQSEKENALLKRAVVAQSHQNKALEEALKARCRGRCCVGRKSLIALCLGVVLAVSRVADSPVRWCCVSGEGR